MSLVEEIKVFEALTESPRGQKALVFYSEGPEYWPHFRGIVRELIAVHKCPLIYIASTPDDPGLHLSSPLVRTFNIGKGGSRANLFKEIEADIMVLTMPDLAQLTLARSPRCRDYVYLFHSPVSTHMVYRNGAFDHYDTVFCAGPHHEAEIRKRESMLGLAPKRVFRHGYSRLDDLIAEAGQRSSESGPPDGRTQVLLAPSWGPSGIIETMGRRVVTALLDAGFRVVVRPHPQTARLSKPAIDEIVAKCAGRDGFVLETDMASKQSFFDSQVMISDWSGAALEFAFARLKPVIFVDTPRKVNNPDWPELGIEPLEASIREEIGAVVDPADLAALADAVRTAVSEGGEYRERIRAARDKWIYNVEESDRIAAEELARLTFNASLGDEGHPHEVEARCLTLARSLLPPPASPETPGSLRGLLAAMIVEESLSVPDAAAPLGALCRRVDVHKRLHEQYDAEFRKPVPQSRFASSSMLPALICAFVGGAKSSAKSSFGTAMKYLNSAGNTLDIYAREPQARGLAAFESLLARTVADVRGRAT